MIRIAHIPSSIRGFRSCARRWRYQQDAPPEDKAEFRYGTEIHRQREEYLRYGTPLVGAAAAGAEHLPPAGSGDQISVLVEYGWGMVVGPVWLHGTADLVDLRDPNLPILGDHKSTSLIERYALRPEQLAADPQLNCYAHWVLTEKAPRARLIVLQHHYVEKPDGDKLPRGECREVVVTRDSVDTQWAGIVQTIEQMAVYRCLEPDDVPANSAACSEWGGCRFLNVCRVGNPP
jgi:hypothetical protein